MQLTVALRKESVDRNVGMMSRRKRGKAVALRKESVDRNIDQMKARGYGVESLSARRAWIEILEQARCLSSTQRVALRKESVDRNRQREIVKFSVSGRSPQGERG